MDDSTGQALPGRTPWPAFLILLGLYLSCHGYHSRDGDQAYRLPLLLHHQDSSVYADDPFVRAFATFNPHAGYLALLDGASRLLGLSAALAVLYALTFLLTCIGIDRLTRSVWPGSGTRIGVLAVGLILTAKAGNIGTNHLFEPLLLDRLIALGLGWLALAEVVARPERGRWTAPPLIALAAWIHPSLGLQLGMLLVGTWITWAFSTRKTGVRPWLTFSALVLLGLAMSPVLVFAGSRGDELLKGLPEHEMRLLSVFVQGPQHMVPHLWRGSQWLAWGCYPALAWLSCRGGSRSESTTDAPRFRLILALLVVLAALAMAWMAVEMIGDLRCTLFQPFRMATVARGIALVLLAEHVRRLWEGEGWTGRARAVLLVVGLTGDWTLVVVTLAELATMASGWVGRVMTSGNPRRWSWLAGAAVLGLGLVFLSRHDTESGHLRLLAALGLIGIAMVLPQRFWSHKTWTPGRTVRVAALAWMVPVAALVAGFVAPGEAGRGGRLVGALVERCRFAEVPTDDMERLALWCRRRTPRSARFVGPPGPKTFRLWSLRPLAFNRAASPYHAEGLADWAARFRDHVGFEGSTAEFARAYLADHQGLERRYLDRSHASLAALARRQEANHVIAAPPRPGEPSDASLELLHTEGRYAVYRLRPGVPAIASNRSGIPGTSGGVGR